MTSWADEQAADQRHARIAASPKLEEFCGGVALLSGSACTYAARSVEHAESMHRVKIKQMVDEALYLRRREIEGYWRDVGKELIDRSLVAVYCGVKS